MATNTATLSGDRGLAAARAAEGMLRALGGGPQIVRVPMPLAGGSESTEIGLSGAANEDVVLDPAVLRNPRLRSGQRTAASEVVLSAATLARTRDLHDSDSIRQFFESAVGFVIQQRVRRIVAIVIEEFGGEPYLCRIRLES